MPKTQSENILISVITINYNNATGLRKTLDSVCSQSLPGFEYIVIDGGSTDGSVDVIERYADKITYSVSEKDKGIYNAMNKGIARATGEYILFINSGDFLLGTDALAKAVPHLTGEDIVYFDLHLRWPDKDYVWQLPDKLSFNHFVQSSLPHPASFIRKSLFDKYGPYEEQYKICSDWKFFMDVICKHNATYKHVGEVISEFSMDGISSDSKQAENMSRERAAILEGTYGMFVDDYLQAVNDRKIVGKLKTSRLFGVLRKAGFFKYIDI